MVYHRIVQETTWPRPGPEMFLERARTLLALSATCRLMRQLVLAEGWNNYFMRRMSLKDEYQIWVKLLFECGVLFGKPHLAAYVRYGSSFVYLEYLGTSPNYPKNPGGRSHGRDQKSSRTLRQMPHYSTQPPYPRDSFDAEARGRRSFPDRPEEGETPAPAPAGSETHPAPRGTSAVGVLPERRGSHMLFCEIQQTFRWVPCGKRVKSVNETFGYVCGRGEYLAE